MRGKISCIFAPPVLAWGLGCGFDASGMPGGGASVGDGLDSGRPGNSDGAHTADAGGQTTDGTTTSASNTDGMQSSGETSATETEASGCTPGELGCPCDDELCGEGLECRGNTCVPPPCPNGILDRDEQCDDGNAVDDDGCDHTCTLSQGASQIDVGRDHTCAVLHGGRLRCWGNGGHGKTGLETTSSIGDDEVPQSVQDVEVGANVTHVALGGAFSCALVNTGAIRCWGFYDQGRLGYGSGIDADIGDDEPAGSGGNVNIGGKAIGLAAGVQHACALLEDGQSLLCWGNGTAGRLGYGNVEPVGETNQPADVGPVDLGGAMITKVVAGLAHTCVLLQDGNVRCWGAANAGRLGIPGTTNIGDDETPTAAPVLQLGGTAVDLTAGDQHTCALLQDGTVRCWGEGDLGRLGTGGTADIGDDEHPAAGVVSLGLGARMVAAGRNHTCVVLIDDTVRCFGEGAHGKLGYGDTTNRGNSQDTVPAMLPPVSFVASPSPVLGLAVGGDHTCVRLAGGVIRCWGRGNRGQLGYGNNTDIGDDELPSSAGDVPFM